MDADENECEGIACRLHDQVDNVAHEGIISHYSQCGAFVSLGQHLMFLYKIVTMRHVQPSRYSTIQAKNIPSALPSMFAQ